MGAVTGGAIAVGLPISAALLRMGTGFRGGTLCWGPGPNCCRLRGFAKDKARPGGGMGIVIRGRFGEESVDDMFVDVVGVVGLSGPEEGAVLVARDMTIR